MKTKILLSFCCLLAITSFCQDSTFQLKNYKYRTKGYTVLEFSTSLGGALTNQKNLSADTTKGRSFQLFPSWIYYKKIISTDKKLLTSVFSTDPILSFSSQEKNSIHTKNNYGYATFKWQFDNRFFKENKWFWQLGNELSGEFNLYKQSESSVTDKNNHLASTDELILGFGKGRIEMVQDAQMALFILNDLEEEGLVDHQPNTETVNRFAQLITDLNNRRIFDFRRKRIYELTQIESFLREKGITNSTDIRHFTIVNDNWAFAFNPFRSSGSDWFFHIVPSAGFDNFKTTEENSGAKTIFKTYNTILGIGPEIGYENYKPINLKWQRNMHTTFSWTYYKNNGTSKSTISGITTKTEGSSYSNDARFYFNYGLDYYPNNRTRINSSFDLLTTIIESEFLIKPSLNFSTDYFISFRTRLSASFSTKYQYDYIKYIGSSSNKMHNLDINFGLGISHAFL